jgi:hypothetical protein
MNYQEFVYLWGNALRRARFPYLHPSFSHETVDLRSMDRTYRVYLHGSEMDVSKLFHVSAEVSWVWDTLLSARFATTEEDLLMQIYEDFDVHEDTDLPWLRMDIVLNASNAYGELIPLPLLTSWQKWVQEVNATVNPVLSEEERWDRANPSSYAWRGTPQAEISFGSQGQVYLQRVSLESWQGITLPRQWDDPDKVDPDPEGQLNQLAMKIKHALKLWEKSLISLIDDNGLDDENGLNIDV